MYQDHHLSGLEHHAQIALTVSTAGTSAFVFYQ
jgi:hypothetical protein